MLPARYDDDDDDNAELYPVIIVIFFLHLTMLHSRFGIFLHTFESKLRL